MTWWTYANLAHSSGGDWITAPSDVEAPLPSHGVSIDSRDTIAGRVYVALRGARHDGHDFLHEAVDAGASMLVVERDAETSRLPTGIPTLSVRDCRAALGELAGAYRNHFSGLRVIAVTGSNGKTTTCRILFGVLSQRWNGTRSRRSFNNDIGLPLTLLNAGEKDDFVICEIGTNAPGEIAALSRIAQPHLAIITCIGLAHTEGLGGRDGVAREKAAITAGMPAGGFLLCRDLDAGIASHIDAAVRCERFGASMSADHRIVDPTAGDNGQPTGFSLHGERYHLPLVGEHNAWNASAVVAMALHLGLSPDEIRAGLASVLAPSMRGEVMEIDGILVINDAYNANPDSVRASLKTFAALTNESDRRVFVLGDMLELGEKEAHEHQELGREIAREGVIDVLITVGRLACLTARSAKERSPELSCIEFDQLGEQACEEFASQLCDGDAVLLKGSRAMRLERIAQAIQNHRTPGNASVAVS